MPSFEVFETVAFLKLRFSILQHQVADVWVVKSSELGMEPTTVHTRSHMGHILKPGDLVLG